MTDGTPLSKIPYDDIFRETFGRYEDIFQVRYAQGKATIWPNTGIRVGSRQDFTVNFIVGPSGIEAGGCLKFCFPHTWSKPQTEDPEGEGYVSANCRSASVSTSISQWEPLEWYVTVRTATRLESGKVLRLSYRKVVVQRFPQSTWRNWRGHLEVFVCASAGGGFRPLAPEDRYTLEIVSGPPAKLQVAVPASTLVGEPFDVTVSVLDEFRNPSLGPYEGALNVEMASSASVTRLPGGFRADGCRNTLRGLALDSEGVFVLRLADERLGLRESSNPTECRRTPPRFNVYFGDLNAKSGISAGLCTPEEVYFHARHVAGADFAAIADYNDADCSTADDPCQKRMSEGQWQEIKSAAEKCTVEGKFVALLAVDEASPDMGRYIIYYPDTSAPLPPESNGKATWDFLRGRRAIVAAHATLAGASWHRHDPAREKLIEVYSMAGSCEERPTSAGAGRYMGLSVGEILSTGARVGFIGGSDNHHGHPHLSSYPSRLSDRSHPGGITAILSAVLTREALFEALDKRRCYATTGAHMIVSFTLDGYQMGSEVPHAGHPKDVLIRARVVGTAPVETVALLKNGALLAQEKGRGEVFEKEWSDQAKIDDYYYLRVLQVDGSMAWASPIWIGQREAH